MIYASQPANNGRTAFNRREHLSFLTAHTTLQMTLQTEKLQKLFPPKKIPSKKKKMEKEYSTSINCTSFSATDDADDAVGDQSKRLEAAELVLGLSKIMRLREQLKEHLTGNDAKDLSCFLCRKKCLLCKK